MATMPGLSEGDLAPDPLSQFHRWFAGVTDHAMTLVTATPDGVPSGRMVLLKGADEKGFAFYTNYASAKAADLAANPRAALVFYWPPHRQVRVSGRVERIAGGESEAYWRSRPRAGRLGAWASRQSEVIPDRAHLEDRLAEITARFPGDDIPLPPFWGGYRLAPETVEFWCHREDRLHDRFRYRRAVDGGGWLVERLSP
ncbi:MAG: pyridoxamine 5'-phosphate oxidase [Acidimicrobiia bacterium]